MLAWAVFVDAGVLNLSLCFLAAILAWGYGWLDREAFGDLVGHEREPEPDEAQRKRLAQIAERCPVHKTLANWSSIL